MSKFDWKGLPETPNDDSDKESAVPTSANPLDATSQHDCDAQIMSDTNETSWIVLRPNCKGLPETPNDDSDKENPNIQHDCDAQIMSKFDWKGPPEIPNDDSDKENASGNPLNAALQHDCDAHMFTSSQIEGFVPALECDLSDGISVISEIEGPVVEKTPSILPPFPDSKTESSGRRIITRNNTRCLLRRRKFFSSNSSSSVQSIRKSDDKMFTVPRMLLAFLVLCAILITIMQYSFNVKNNAQINDLINRIEEVTNRLSNLHKDMVQIKNEIRLNKLLNIVDNDKTEHNQNVVLDNKIFGSDENNGDGIKSESTTDNNNVSDNDEFNTPGTQERRNDWKEGYKHGKHKNFYNKNQKSEKNYKDTSQRKHNMDNHFKYDKYSNEKMQEKYAKGETNQEFPKDDHPKHFNNNDKRIKDFDYNKKYDHDHDKDWYENMMDLREKYRAEKQNKDKYNWYIQRGGERERIRDSDVEYR